MRDPVSTRPPWSNRMVPPGLGRRQRLWRYGARLSGITALTFASVASIGGCGTTELTPYAAKPMALHTLTPITISAGGTTLQLPLTTATASGSVVTTNETGCTASLVVTTTAKDGTCALSLSFGPRTDGPGLALTDATLVGRNAKGTCASLAGRLPTGTDDAIYSLSSGTAWLPWIEPKKTDVVEGSIALDKLLFDLRGEITLTTAGTTPDALTLADHSVRIGGDVALQASDSGTCAPCTDKACESPYPQIRLRDAQPKSVAHNLEYSLDRWLGQYLVVILTQGW